MKSHSPALMGTVIFAANLGIQAVSSGNDHIDIFRAVAIAFLAAIMFYVLTPLFTSNTASERKQIESRNHRNSRRDNS